MDKPLTAYESARLFVELSPGPDKLLDNAVERLHEIDKLIDKGDMTIKPWVCELCYNTYSGDGHLPKTWHIILLTVICPECVSLAKKEKKYIPDMKGGIYAPSGREDPRLYYPFSNFKPKPVEEDKIEKAKKLLEGIKSVLQAVSREVMVVVSCDEWDKVIQVKSILYSISPEEENDKIAKAINVLSDRSRSWQSSCNAAFLLLRPAESLKQTPSPELVCEGNGLIPMGRGEDSVVCTGCHACIVKPEKTIEAIKHAAIKIGLFVGRGSNHAQVFESQQKGFFKGSKQGFETTTGRFVDRIEAAEIAFKADQIPKWEKDQSLISEELWHTGPYLWNKEQGYYLPGERVPKVEGRACPICKKPTLAFLEGVCEACYNSDDILLQLLQRIQEIDSLKDENRQWQETTKAVQGHRDCLIRQAKELEAITLSGEKVIRELKVKLSVQVRTSTIKELDVSLLHTKELAKLKKQIKELIKDG